jgi:hypothetical protein
MRPDRLETKRSDQQHRPGRAMVCPALLVPALTPMLLRARLGSQTAKGAPKLKLSPTVATFPSGLFFCAKRRAKTIVGEERLGASIARS